MDIYLLVDYIELLMKIHLVNVFAGLYLIPYILMIMYRLVI